MRFRLLLALLLLFGLASLARTNDPPAKVSDAKKTFQVPYKLTDTQHVLVRAKINGKGPFNFIVDTGAPLLYVSIPVAKKLGITPEKKGLTNLERFEIEGGIVHTKFPCLIDTPFQLEGMNAMGMPGAELHGIIGYTLLAHYKMEFDFTRDKMTWVRLDFKPPEPVSLGMKGGAPGGLDAIGGFMKGLAILTGKKPTPEPLPRGFLGIELAEKDGTVSITTVLEKSPAFAAGLQAGDLIRVVQGKETNSAAEVLKQVATVTAGQSVRLTVQRGGESKEVTVTTGEGL
jgi:hypothetical protein